MAVLWSTENASQSPTRLAAKQAILARIAVDDNDGFQRAIEQWNTATNAAVARVSAILLVAI